MPKPKIDTNKCNGCMTCVDICPMNVFVKEEGKDKPKVSDAECIGCRACEAQCPKEAITVEDDE